MFEIFEREIKPGSIVLLHDGYFEKSETKENTVKVTEMILEKYTKLGWKFVTISELLSYRKKINIKISIY
jgi:peptidoglycan/xylan/chitin deacetylase (PgdA/CDA1 family)